MNESTAAQRAAEDCCSCADNAEYQLAPDDFLEIIEAAITAAERAKWVSVSQLPPEHLLSVWVWTGSQMTRAYYDEFYGRFTCAGTEDEEDWRDRTVFGVTHWQAVTPPQPPDTTSEES